MTRFSLIVPAYNIERYVGRCLESIAKQSFGDFEVVVVDDSSADSTSEIVDGFVAADPRFRVVRHGENRGRHHARISGVEACEGEWVLFLDGDDELCSPDVLDALDRHARRATHDMVRFCLEAIPEQGLAAETARSFQDWSNHMLETVPRDELLRRCFRWEEGFACPWHLTHRLMRGEVVRDAFARMTRERLDRAEDAYEFFVVAALSDGEDACDVMGYAYHMGVGVTGASMISRDRFSVEAEQVRRCYEAMLEFATSQGDPEVIRAARDTEEKLLESVGNTLVERLRPEDFAACAESLRSKGGEAEAGCELWRFVRDRAYGFVEAGEVPPEGDVLDAYRDAAEQVRPGDSDPRQRARCERMRRIAESHLAQLDGMRQLDAYRAEPVRVFVTTHKPVDVPAGSCFQPVQVGPALRRPGGRVPDSFHDDDGADNISDRNPMYCEMTVQYWAWKNALAGADYVGFCHYRRYFNLSGTTYEENPYGEVMDDYIDGDAIRRYGLDDEHVRAAVEGYDVITTGFHSLASIPGDFSTPLEHYESAPLLHVGDLRRVIDILSRMHPEYERDAREFLSARDACFCNMYIMRAEIFSAYCDWLFPVLDAFMAETDMSRYSKEALRTPGHLAERLFNIYYRHAMRTGAGWRTKQVQCVHFTSPDREYPLEPIVLSRPEAAESGVVPVVFASDDAYVPMLTTTILSMLSNADRTRFYDIVVLERNIGPAKRAAVEEVVSRFGNASVRFHNVARMVHGYDLGTNNEHISMETYYRFLVQDILSDYDKVLYLDSDLIVRGDVAELFDVELGDDLLAAARDVDYLGNLNMNDGKRMAYTTERLGLAEPYDYFQAGVLVLNTRALRDLHAVPEWMRIVSEADFIYDDQDILNAECQGRVTFLPFEWNVMHDCGGRVDAVFKFAPNDAFDAYMASRANPKVVHYAGWEKPWVNPDCDFAAEYWRYARQTPFYEMLIARLASNVAGVAPAHAMPVHEKAVSPTSPLRRVIDPIAPYGTARREVLKAIGRAARGRK